MLLSYSTPSLQPMSLRAILFDLDGTLVNTDPVHFKIWHQMLLEAMGRSIDHAFFNTRISGRLNDLILQEFFPNWTAEQAKAFAVKKEALFREKAGELTRMPGLTAFLEWIAEQGLQQALVTNAPRPNVDFMLNVLRLSDAFPVLIVGEEAPAAKPDPAPYQMALKALEISVEEAIVFEDSPAGLRSAVGAGIYTVGVASCHPSESLYQLGASLVINDFTDPKLHKMLEARYSFE